MEKSRNATSKGGRDLRSSQIRDLLTFLGLRKGMAVREGSEERCRKLQIAWGFSTGKGDFLEKGARRNTTWVKLNGPSSRDANGPSDD